MAMVARSGLKILMVDDEPNNLLALEAVLEREDYALVRASSGEAALKLAAEGDFAIILMDVSMPGMNGFEAAAIIHSRENTGHTPIIFLTAMGKSEADVIRGYEVGAVDYLLKPFSPEILRYKVRVLIELNQRAVEIEHLNLELNLANASLELRVHERTEALELRSRDLARANHDMAQFSVAASLDLEAPLAAISANLLLLKEAPEGGLPGAERPLALARAGAERMRRLLDDLLAYAQVGDGSRPEVAVDCGELVDVTLAGMAQQIGRLKASVHVSTLPVVQADRSLLAQLFKQLFSNALKFHREVPPVLDLSARQDLGRWVFALKDNGIGIQPEHFSKVFKVFQRLNPRAEYPGTGLGLSLCKRIVENRGGRIWLDSIPGVGSTFQFSIPIQR
jgi:signal transduction histidine kinase